MQETRKISKTNASFPDYLNFKGLRELGIAHCQALGRDLWTDFNLHDPGLTILEAVCYALTDLGYRTNLPIEDLIARSPEQSRSDGGTGLDDNFFTPEQILTCNPVTLLDLRKLLIDVPGVRNAWVEPADAAEVTIYLDEASRALQYEPPRDLENDQAGIADAIVAPDGLYVVCLELDPDEVPDACGVQSVPVDSILEDVWALLHEHRNLCEDFVDVVILGDEDIALCADIELAASADPEDVMLGMYRAIEEFLSPTLKFYTLQDMLARGRRIEEIYAGRPLSPLAGIAERAAQGKSHGFLDPEELMATERRSRLHVSDLYRVIMDIPGVLAVRKLLAVNYVNGFPQTRGEKWCIHVTPKHRQRFDLERSRIQFFKELLPYGVDKGTVARRFDEERAARAKAPLQDHHLDQAVPEGRYRGLGEYRSVVHEFPRVYGIGEGGLPESAPTERKDQGRQLRAYLLFYDQIMANYLAQLANLRSLFSMRPDADPTENHTYFSQVLSDIPEIEELLQNYNRCQSEQGYAPVPEHYPDYLQHLVESPETYYSRRNQFLDHLLARFAESFTDYVLLMFDIGETSRGNRDKQQQRLIRDKADFLRSYPETSRDRGKGFDYTDPVVWDTGNVSGVEKRVSRMLGFGSSACRLVERRKGSATEPFARRTLGRAQVVEIDGAWQWHVDLAEFAGASPGTLRSQTGFESRSEAIAAFAEFQQHARDERNYRRLSYSGFRHYGFEVLAPREEGRERAGLAEHDRYYPPSRDRGDSSERDSARATLVKYFAEHSGTESEPISEPPQIAISEAEGFFRFAVVAAPVGSPKSRFLSSGQYPSADLAAKAADIFVRQAADEGEYRSLSRDGFEHYGFAVISPDEMVLAEVDQPWSNIEERDLQIYHLLQTLIGGAVRCELDQAKQCHFYELLDATAENVLLRAVRGYGTREEAVAAFENVLLPAAGDESNYRDLDDDAGAGFELLGPSEGDILATHPRRYETEAERALRKLAVTYYVGRPEISFKIDGSKGSYEFEVKDANDLVVFKGVSSYTTRDEANQAFRVLREKARERSNYRLTVTTGPDEKYGFELGDGEGQVLAVHPIAYAEVEARDLAITYLLRLFCPSHDLCFDVRDRAGAYEAVLLAEDGAELLVSVESYASPLEAREAGRWLLDLAARRERYAATDDDEGYGFGLRGIASEIVATHPTLYSAAPERDLAMDFVHGYVRPGSVECSIEGEPSQLRFFLLALDGRELLRSSEIYSDEAAAENALEVALAIARETSRYCLIEDEGSFGFTLADDNGTVAEHGGRFATAAERDAMIALIVTYLSRAEVQLNLDNPTGAFRFELYDEAGNAAFVGTEVLPNREAANETYLKARTLARDRQSYRGTEDGPLGCRFGYEIIGPDEIPVGRDPRTYASAAFRDEAMGRLYALVHDGETIPDPVYFGLQIVDERPVLGRQVMLESPEKFISRDEAGPAFKRLLRLAVCEKHYRNVGGAGALSFEIADGPAVLAHHPRSYKDARERDRAIQETIAAVQSHELPHRIEESEEGTYSFQYLAEDGSPALVGVEQAPSRAAARELFLASAERAIDRYAYVADDSCGEFGFQLTRQDGSPIARHPRNYASPRLRDQALHDWFDYVSARAEEVLGRAVRARFRLLDFAGESLLQSVGSWLTADEAESVFRETFAPLAADEKSYRRIHDNSACRYTFAVEDPHDSPSGRAAGALHLGQYKLPRQRDEKIASAVDLVRAQTRHVELAGVACGHFFRLVAEGCELTSVSYYPDPSEAASACSNLLASLSSEDAYVIEPIGGGRYRLLAITADKRVGAVSGEDDYDAIASQRDCLLAAATEESEVPHRFEETHSELVCRITDASGETILQSRRGPSAGVVARAQGFESGQSCDAAMQESLGYFGEEREPPLRTEERDGGFYFVFGVGEDWEIESRWSYASVEAAVEAGKKLPALARESKNYRPLDLGERGFGFEVIDQEKAAAGRETQCEECSTLVELAQDPDAYRFVTASGACAFGFELLGNDREVLAKGPRFFPTEQARAEYIDAIRCSADVEGFHLVEHLLLRPRQVGIGPGYGFEIEDSASGAILLRSIDSVAEREAVIEQLMDISDRIVAGENVVLATEDGQAFGFQVKGGDGVAIAAPPSDFCSAEDRDEALASFVAYVESEFSDAASRGRDALDRFVVDLRSASDLQSDALIPLGGGCRGSDGKLCPVRSDPYSFRASVIVPYWPQRFRRPEFRPFFERTLRREMPAHVYPRICWVDVCQMNEFEESYRRWLNAMQNPGGDCDRSAAQNDLVRILFDLTSVYGTARLFDCAGGDITNPIRLDQTILGTAGVEDDDSN